MKKGELWFSTNMPVTVGWTFGVAFDKQNCQQFNWRRKKLMRRLLHAYVTCHRPCHIEEKITFLPSHFILNSRLHSQSCSQTFKLCSGTFCWSKLGIVLLSHICAFTAYHKTVICICKKLITNSQTVQDVYIIWSHHHSCPTERWMTAVRSELIFKQSFHSGGITRKCLNPTGHFGRIILILWMIFLNNIMYVLTVYFQTGLCI